MVTVNNITPTTPDKLTLTLTQGGVNKVLTRMWCVKCGFITYAKDADDKQSGINILAFERLELVGGNITCPRCDLSFLEVDYTDMAAVDTEPTPPPPSPNTCEYCKHFNFKSSGLKNWGACSNEKTNAAMYISLRHVDPELHKEVGKANIFLCESDFGCVYFEEDEHDNTGII